MKAKARNKNYGLWLIASCFLLTVANSINNSAFSQNPNPQIQKVGLSCSEQNLEILTTQLLRDLPSYANRASQRSRRLKRSSDIYSYVLLAGRPEFQPIPLNSSVSTVDNQTAATEIEQVFFTTLERQYIGSKVVELQEFHWLLLTTTKSGRRLVMMFTKINSDSPQQPPSPPRDSSKGTIAQAIKAWLRDCQAGSVRNFGV